MRSDLSQIHPLKRVTLIVLGFMFGVSLVLALAGQFLWMSVLLQSPGSILNVEMLKHSIVLVREPLESNSWYLGFNYDDTPGLDPVFDDSLLPVGAVHIPGLYVLMTYQSVVAIHYIWLIAITAALYLFTHWRIRRTARLQSQSS